MYIDELFQELETKYNIKTWEDDEDRKTITILKNNEETVTICCLYNVQDNKDNLFRMDYCKYHDRWANCDYEEPFNYDEDVQNIYNDIVFWIENTSNINEDFYDKYSQQEYDLNEYMKINIV